MTELWLVEASSTVMTRARVGAARAGFTFLVRSVQSGSSSALEGGTEDDGQVAPLALRLERTAAVLDCSKSTVQRLIRSGQLRAVKVAGGTRVRVADLEDYLSHLPTTTETSA